MSTQKTITDYPVRREFRTPLGHIFSTPFVAPVAVILAILAFTTGVYYGIAAVLALAIPAAALIVWTIIAVKEDIQIRKEMYAARQNWWKKNLGLELSRQELETLQYGNAINVLNPNTNSIERYKLIQASDFTVIGVTIMDVHGLVITDSLTETHAAA